MIPHHNTVPYLVIQPTGTSWHTLQSELCEVIIMVPVVWYFDTLLQYTCNVYMCVHSYCWISGSMCMRFNYLTRLLTPRGYGIVCMLVAHNTCTIHTETSAPVVCCHYTCILWSTYRIVHSTVLVIMVMLLELKKIYPWAQTSATIIVNGWVQGRMQKLKKGLHWIRSRI